MYVILMTAYWYNVVQFDDNTDSKWFFKDEWKFIYNVTENVRKWW